MDNSLVINEFEKNNKTSRIIAQEQNMSKREVISLLKNFFGPPEFLKIARRNAAIQTNKKIDRVSLGKRISKSLLKKMDNPEFHRKWIIKTKKASLIARNNVSNLLCNNTKFREKWRKNCSKGGLSSFQNKKGFYDPNHLLKRKEGSLKGLQKTGRKVLGPHGEMMYNKLEQQTATFLVKQLIEYEYEKTFSFKNANGYISCDFVFSLGQKTFFIEVTTWDKAEDKIKRLNKKFQFYKKINDNAICLLVTSNRFMKDKYSPFVSKNVQLLTLKELKEKVARVGFEPTTSGL